jgi:hydrogenase expression/formation protein HypE
MLDFENWTCPVPLRDTHAIVMGHGGGGAMSEELVQHLFLPAYGSSPELSDSAVLPFPGGRLAFSTDSYVVKPMFFPGGSIGDLAVNGTVNDLAMSGARPLYLSTAFILQEGTLHGPPGSSSSPATPRSSTAAAGTASSSTPPGSAWWRPAWTSGRRGPPPATPC